MCFLCIEVSPYCDKMSRHRKAGMSIVRQTWVSCILLSTVVSSSAVTLGAHSGAALIGLPLDVKVQVLLAPGEDMGALCIGADIFYGDSQVPASQVLSTPQKTTSDNEIFIRVQSSQTVNEPIVTVFLRAGCDARFTRRFVLLADLPTELLVEPVPAPATENRSDAVSQSVSGNLPSVEGVQVGSSARGSNGPDATASAMPLDVQQPPRATMTQPTADARPAKPVVRPPRPKPTSGVSRPLAARTDSAPRLRLDPVELSLASERDPVLKMSIDLLSEPATSGETRASAAQLWKAINASPEEVLRDAQKLAVLEGEFEGLHDADSQSKLAIAELTSNLKVAKAERYMNGLVYLLVIALLLALLALVVLWRRWNQFFGAGADKAWWASESASKNHSLAPQRSTSAVDVDLDLDVDKDISIGAVRQAGSSKIVRDALDSLSPLDESMSTLSTEIKDKPDFSPHLIGASRSVATEELFDVQQQADFFVSLGEDERAIQVLHSHLIESNQSSALAYLDLLKIYHRLERRSDYELTCNEFRQVFNAETPAFDEYSVTGLGLEAYKSALDRIQALWPHPMVLDVIEQLIFRNPNVSESEVFDIEAYRELLMLHGIAKDIIQSDAATAHVLSDLYQADSKPLMFIGKINLPINDADRYNTQPFDMALPASSRLGLDIDLNDLSEFSEFDVSLPKVADPEKSAIQSEHTPSFESIEQKGNLIDFEMIDFMSDKGRFQKPSDKT